MSRDDAALESDILAATCSPHHLVLEGRGGAPGTWRHTRLESRVRGSVGATREHRIFLLCESSSWPVRGKLAENPRSRPIVRPRSLIVRPRSQSLGDATRVAKEFVTKCQSLFLRGERQRGYDFVLSHHSLTIRPYTYRLSLVRLSARARCAATPADPRARLAASPPTPCAYARGWTAARPRAPNCRLRCRAARR